MNYIPNTPAEREEMLAAIGRRCVDELFSGIPQELRLRNALKLPQAQSEMELLAGFEALAAKNTVYKTCLRGAGAYRHFIPSVVRSLSAREEFVTAYTPYQAELSQGVLQAIFEYQTTVCALTGMDVSNAGVYDGAHAAAEAAAMYRDKKRGKTLVSAAVKPMTLAVLRTYCAAAGSELLLIPEKDGTTDLAALRDMLDEQSAGVYLENPNYFGQLEDCSAAAQLIHAAGAKLILGCYPTALATIQTPRECAADAAVGEMQPLGMPLSFGGPYLGYMAVMNADMRRLPGRIVGQTSDKDGRTAYVLTLQAREQQIRREKASSSICSNEALCALTATIYCAAMGKEGLREVAQQCLAKAHYAAKAIAAVPGFELQCTGEFFHEFVTACPVPPEQLEQKLAEQGILCGLPLLYHGRDCILWCVTETVSKQELDRLITLLQEVCG